MGISKKSTARKNGGISRACQNKFNSHRSPQNFHLTYAADNDGYLLYHTQGHGTTPPVNLFEAICHGGIYTQHVNIQNKKLPTHLCSYGIGIVLSY